MGNHFVQPDDNCTFQSGTVLGLRYRENCEPFIIGNNGSVRSGSVIYADVRARDFFQTGHNVMVREHTVFGDHIVVGTNTVKVGLALHQREAIYSFVSTGNGRKFFSYMQAGISIVGPNFGEVAKAVTVAYCDVRVDTENANEVSKAITKLLDRPDEASRMAANGRRAFLEHFNWEKEENKFLSIVDKIVN